MKDKKKRAQKAVFIDAVSERVYVRRRVCDCDADEEKVRG